MAPDEFKDLVESIHRHGLQHPIVIYEDKVLDGRHRLRACLEASVEPRFTTFEGSDPTAYVVAANVKRRHLNAGQLALAAARLAQLRQGQKAGNAAVAVTQTDAAKLFGVSTDSIQRARIILESGDEVLIGRVNAGTVSISAAHATLRPRKPACPKAAPLFCEPDNDNEALGPSSVAELIRDLEKLDVGFVGVISKLSSDGADLASVDIKNTLRAMHGIIMSRLSRLRTR
jgi:hypothetical protein